MHNTDLLFVKDKSNNPPQIVKYFVAYNMKEAVDKGFVNHYNTQGRNVKYVGGIPNHDEGATLLLLLKKLGDFPEVFSQKSSFSTNTIFFHDSKVFHAFFAQIPDGIAASSNPHFGDDL